MIGVRRKAGDRFHRPGELLLERDGEWGERILAVEIDEVNDGFMSFRPLERFQYCSEGRFCGDGEPLG